MEEEEGEGIRVCGVGRGREGEKEGKREREESEWVRAREREVGSKRREVVWGGEEREQGVGRVSLEPSTTTIREKKLEITIDWIGRWKRKEKALILVRKLLEEERRGTGEEQKHWSIGWLK